MLLQFVAPDNAKKGGERLVGWVALPADVTGEVRTDGQQSSCLLLVGSATSGHHPPAQQAASSEGLGTGAVPS